MNANELNNTVHKRNKREVSIYFTQNGIGRGRTMVPVARPIPVNTGTHNKNNKSKAKAIKYARF